MSSIHSRQQIRSAAAFIALTLLLVVSLLGCAGNTYPNPIYKSPYNWEGLETVDSKLYYSHNGESSSFVGIDVSEHQKVIDWKKVANDDIDFAIIRLGNRGATEGKIYLDNYYYTNIEGAQKAGLKTGVYFFSQAINAEEAREEAEFVLSHLGKTELDYPVVFDHEPVAGIDGRADALSKEQMTVVAQVFCETVEQAGYTAMVYGNKKDIARYDSSVVSAYDVWFAEYGVPTPTAQFDFVIWQYSNAGSVDGVPTNVDMNIHFLLPGVL